jgi:hypothetical protein
VPEARTIVIRHAVREISCPDCGGFSFNYPFLDRINKISKDSHDWKNLVDPFPIL